jgi:hypothetical protein
MINADAHDQLFMFEYTNRGFLDEEVVDRPTWFHYDESIYFAGPVG